MCLNTVTDEVKKKYSNRRYGWKIFRVGPQGGLYGEYVGIDEVRKERQWLFESDFRHPLSELATIPSSDGLSYHTGFHILLKKPMHGGPPWFVTKRVYFREPVAWGIDCGMPVVVVKEIFIGNPRGV